MTAVTLFVMVGCAVGGFLTALGFFRGGPGAVFTASAVGDQGGLDVVRDAIGIFMTLAVPIPESPGPPPVRLDCQFGRNI